MSNQVLRPTSESALQEIFSKTPYVIVDFYADWCGPCKTIAPIFNQLAATHTVPGWLAFVKVNVDQLQNFAAKHQISSIPTFMFFKDGKSVAANGKAKVQDVPGLKAAAAKIGGLAKAKAEAG
jgi:thioredoxin 1